MVKRKRSVPRLAYAALLAGLAQASLPASGRAQMLYDHLACYKIKDATKFVATATLTALQAEFGAQECTLAGKAVLFCAPVDKDVTSFDDKSRDHLGQTDLAGSDLSLDRMCYRMKCPAPQIDTLEITDQFGTRRIGRFKPLLLCAPAIKGAPTATTTTSSTSTTTVVDRCAGVVCSASEQCHTAGVCDPATGACSDPLAQDGESCDDADACTHSDSCLQGACAGMAYSCDDYSACTDNVCSGDGSCTFPVTAGNCRISGVCYANGQSNPGNPCERCVSSVSQTAWSPAPQGTACNDGDACTLNDSCEQGVCAGAGYFCDDYLACTDNVCAGDGSCSFPVKAGYCRIAGVCYLAGQSNPLNSCEECVSSAPTAWTPLAQGTACDDGDPITVNDQCVDGVCTGTAP